MSKITFGRPLGRRWRAVLLGAGSAYFNSQQQRAANLQSSQQQRAAHELLISNQVSKGFEQLGSEKIVIRLGGIYALEGVMSGSNQYRLPVLEALTAFVRDGAKLPTTSPPPGPPTSLPTDIQAALTVIGRRTSYPFDPIDLAGTNLTYADLTRTDLDSANLIHANLTRAKLIRVILTRAELANANLTNAYSVFADLSDADLTGADLTGTDLSDANLSGAKLSGANLTRAKLANANLSHADLTSAHLDDQAQLDEACGSDAVLPTGLTLRPCPPPRSP